MAASQSAAAAAGTDTRWLETLSEPELDLLIGLKELAVTRASNAGHPHLADRVFHLGALRALAFVLLQEFKERLRQASSSANKTSMLLERLALLNDDPEDAMPMPTGVRNKRKQMMCDEEGAAQRPKRRKTTREDSSCQSLTK